MTTVSSLLPGPDLINLTNSLLLRWASRARIPTKQPHSLKCWPWVWSFWLLFSHFFPDNILSRYGTSCVNLYIRTSPSPRLSKNLMGFPLAPFISKHQWPIGVILLSLMRWKRIATHWALPNIFLRVVFLFIPFRGPPS